MPWARFEPAVVIFWLAVVSLIVGEVCPSLHHVSSCGTHLGLIFTLCCPDHAPSLRSQQLHPGKSPKLPFPRAVKRRCDDLPPPPLPLPHCSSLFSLLFFSHGAPPHTHMHTPPYPISRSVPPFWTCRVGLRPRFDSTCPLCPVPTRILWVVGG